MGTAKSQDKLSQDMWKKPPDPQLLVPPYAIFTSYYISPFVISSLSVLRTAVFTPSCSLAPFGRGRGRGSSPPCITLPPYTPTTRRQTTRRNGHDVAHAILVALVGVLFALVCAFEAVVPGGDAGEEAIANVNFEAWRVEGMEMLGEEV
jgi:hypothetical protein